ncbi:ABC transporter substrate-binding protein [Thiomicrorhabdus sp. zzn3]|uniref:ABC transporter substrate-binding protein n=1 Tax=Thiomicrorhabdus sp. zzn3 TaxID=3039775 RepID=UPI002436C422|nr:ABC transporter substrate-binding protein [Thiomicrorhabdus sp. zzn3]MDG6777398.1 ABC transporter substrate-binding protein [Thiomicrorhabdus sp. zzn3]
MLLNQSDSTLSVFKRVWWSLVASISILVLVSSVAGCTQKPEPDLRISSLLWPGYEPLVLAHQLGYFEGQNVHVLDYLSNTDAMSAFENHNLEAGAFTLDEALHMLADGADLKIVLIMDSSLGGDVIMANPGIDSVRELKGKAIAVESSAVGAYVLKRALQLNQMTMSDVDVIPTNAIEQVHKFQSGEVEAAVSFNPYQFQLSELGKKVIFDSSQIPNEILDVLVVRNDIIEQQPEKVRLIVKNWFRAVEYQAEHPHQAATHAAERYKMSPQEYIGSLSGLQFVDVATNKRLLNPDNSPLLNLAPQMLENLQALGLVKEGDDYGDRLLKTALTTEFLPK